MNGYFLVYGSSVKNDCTGVGLKIRNQIDSFNNAGLNCSELVIPLSESKTASFLSRLPFFNFNPVWRYCDVFDMADYIYLRRPLVMSGAMRKVFKLVRKRNPKCRIILEIPTYPYDAEYREYKANKLLLWKDIYNRRRLSGIVDRIADLTGEKQIFGIRTIKLVNGINIDSIAKKKTIRLGDNTVHMCAVAMFKEWHGYERIIEGVRQYYENGGNRKILLHFVGEGSELPLYRKLVQLYGLNNYFSFHGFLRGDDLDYIYNISDISLGSFGMYKKNNTLTCDLKSREAVARGIPMVTGCRTDIFDKDKFKYFLEFSNDSNVIDIKKILDFRDAIYSEKPESVIDRIRKYAYETISMDSALKCIIEYIKCG